MYPKELQRVLEQSAYVLLIIVYSKGNYYLTWRVFSKDNTFRAPFLTDVYVLRSDRRLEFLLRFSKT